MIRFLLGLIFCLWLIPTNAEALRCDRRIIDEGDTSFRVERFCGEPDAREFVGVEKTGHSKFGYGYGTRKLEIWHWYYDRGPNKFLVRLRFRGDILVRIDYVEKL